jgi:hypothetical protein
MIDVFSRSPRRSFVVSALALPFVVSALALPTLGFATSANAHPIVPLDNLATFLLTYKSML